MVCFSCIGISSLVGTRVCWILKTSISLLSNCRWVFLQYIKLGHDRCFAHLCNSFSLVILTFDATQSEFLIASFNTKQVNKLTSFYIKWHESYLFYSVAISNANSISVLNSSQTLDTHSLFVVFPVACLPPFAVQKFLQFFKIFMIPRRIFVRFYL